MALLLALALQGPGEDPARVDWLDLMHALRAGGALDDVTRPEGLAFSRLKAMGDRAYPHLVDFIDHEDPLLGRAAVSILNRLTGRKGDLPNEKTRTAIKARWKEWVRRNGLRQPAVALERLIPLMTCESKAEAVRRDLRRLTDDDIEVRKDAEGRVREALLRHGPLLRKAWEEASDPECREFLGSLLKERSRAEKAASSLRGDPTPLRRMFEAPPSWLRDDPDLKDRAVRLLEQLDRP